MAPATNARMANGSSARFEWEAQTNSDCRLSAVLCSRFGEAAQLMHSKSPVALLSDHQTCVRVWCPMRELGADAGGTQWPAGVDAVCFCVDTWMGGG